MKMQSRVVFRSLTLMIIITIAALIGQNTNLNAEDNEIERNINEQNLFPDNHVKFIEAITINKGINASGQNNLKNLKFLDKNYYILQGALISGRYFFEIYFKFPIDLTNHPIESYDMFIFLQLEVESQSIEEIFLQAKQDGAWKTFATISNKLLNLNLTYLEKCIEFRIFGQSNHQKTIKIDRLCYFPSHESVPSSVYSLDLCGSLYDHDYLNGYFYFLTSYQGSCRNRIYKLDSNLNTITYYSIGLSYPQGIEWDGNNWWVLNHNPGRVYKFDQNWNYLGEFHSVGNLNKAIVWNGTHWYIFADTSSDPHKIYDANWNVVRSFNLKNEPYMWIHGGYFDGSDIWLTDWRNANVYRFYLNGTYSGEYHVVPGIPGKPGVYSLGIVGDSWYFLGHVRTFVKLSLDWNPYYDPTKRYAEISNIFTFPPSPITSPGLFKIQAEIKIDPGNSLSSVECYIRSETWASGWLTMTFDTVWYCDVDSSLLSNGKYTIWISANLYPTGKTYNFAIFELDLEDISPPVIIVDYLTGDLTDGNPGKWNVFAYDDESGINEDTINILIDGEFAGDTFGDYDVPNTLGEHTIHVEVENNDRILGSEFDSVIIIDDDTSYPEMNYMYTGDGTDGNPGEIIMTALDESGLSIDPSGTYSVPNSLGTHIFVFTATDNDTDRVDDALTRTVEISIHIIDDDVTAPIIDIQYIGGGFDDDPGYFEWNVFDIDSGINHVNITITYESTEGLDDYTMYLEGTEMGSWELPPNLGIYTIRIFARDNDDDRTLFVDSLTIELTTDQEILDDDVDPPELSNLVIIPNIFEINVTFDAIDESGIGDISTFINGELIEPITQIQYGTTYSFIFENQWLFQSGTSEVLIQVEDGDDDRPNDALASSITGIFENVLYPTYEYIIWQLEELKNYIDENLCHRVVRSLNRKLTQSQNHLYEAFNYFEDGSITYALFHDYLAKLFIRFAEHRTEIFNRKGLIEDYHAEYIIGSLHEIRNNIVLLMGASTGEEQAYEIALIEVELLNLKDFIEDEIPFCVGRYLSAKISCSAKLLELALFKISMGYSIDCILEYTQCKLEHTITKINFLLEKGKIPEDVANYLIEKISSIIGDIEQIKNN